MKEYFFEKSEKFALEKDAQDPLAFLRSQFLIPKSENGQECYYFTGNSLGLQPKNTRQFVDQELEDWARLGVKGHLHARNPWVPYHEKATESLARLVGAKPIEVVAMNSLSVNLNLMMVSFYRPSGSRFKILMEAGAFPSDQYAIASQVKFHGFEPAEAIIELKPRPGESTLRTDDILRTIDEHGSTIALILIGNVNYLTGQAFDIRSITQAGHTKGCQVGFDLAHGVGNIPLQLHDWGPDFAVWCSYKYLNSGPGAIAGAFVHERHARSPELPRFTGWWGHDKLNRFLMSSVFNPISGAEGWQLSNPPILQLAALCASLEVFDQVEFEKLRQKSLELTGYLEFLLEQLPQGYCTIITPKDPTQRGCQLSLRIRNQPQVLLKRWMDLGVICDFREPDIIRAAPVPLYNRFTDVYRFFETLEQDARSAF
jgi:kynureninase